MSEEQGTQGALMEQVLQQLHHLASNYDSLVQSKVRQNQNTGGETSNNTRENTNPLLEGPA